MSYVPPSRRGGAFKSRAAGDAPPSLDDVNASNEKAREDKALRAQPRTDSQVAFENARTQRGGRSMAGARSATAPAQPRTGGQSWERSATNASPPAKAAAPKKKAQPIGVCAFFATHGKCGKGEACRFSHAQEDVQAFLDAGGFEAFAAKRAAKDAEKEQIEAEEKGAARRAKKEAKRLARTGPQGPKMTTAEGSASMEGVDAWAYVPIGKKEQKEQKEKKEKQQEKERKAKKKEEKKRKEEEASLEEEEEAPTGGFEGTDWADFSEDESEEEADAAPPQPAVEGFAALAAGTASEEEESEEEEEVEKPVRVLTQKPVVKAARQPETTLSAKELKAKEMAEFEATLNEVAELTGQQRPDTVEDAAPAAESAAAKKKRLKKQRQKAAKAAAKAHQAEPATPTKASRPSSSDAVGAPACSPTSTPPKPPVEEEEAVDQDKALNMKQKLANLAEKKAKADTQKKKTDKAKKKAKKTSGGKAGLKSAQLST